MAYRSDDLAGPSFTVGDRLITPVARSTEIGFSVRDYGGGGIQYIRPVRIDIERADGTRSSFAVPDRMFQIRLIAVAIVVAALIIGRMR